MLIQDVPIPHSMVRRSTLESSSWSCLVELVRILVQWATPIMSRTNRVTTQSVEDADAHISDWSLRLPLWDTSDVVMLQAQMLALW
jgi:hypothetical protein